MPLYAWKRDIVAHVTSYQVVLHCIRECLAQDSMNVPDRTGRKPLVLFVRVELIDVLNSELLQFAMSEPWDDMLFDQFTIFDVGTFSDFPLMHVLNPVLDQLLHGLI